MSNLEKYEASSKLLKKLKIPAGGKKVLIKTLKRTVDETTPSGILKISEADTDWNPATHADRWGEVTAVPTRRLPFKVGADLMPWETSVEISPGMLVWYDFLNSLNCVTYVDENKVEYKLLDYENLYVATVPKDRDLDLQAGENGEYIIPLNGFHLFERVNMEKRSQYDIFGPMRVDRTRGIVKYVAKNNNAYENGRDSDHIGLQVGDEAWFNTVPEVMLEDEAHCHFDGGRMYRRVQSRNINLVWRGKELILPKGRVVAKQIENPLQTAAGVILLKSNKTVDKARVIVSSLGEVPVESEILYIKGAGMLINYKGVPHRLLRESEILYIKNK